MLRNPKLLDSDVATLLLGVILLDTGNLKKEIGKVTVEDEEAAAELNSMIATNPEYENVFLHIVPLVHLH
jgi:inorganic pyrophosphatase/exopolyphosphatase